MLAAALNLLMRKAKIMIVKLELNDLKRSMEFLGENEVIMVFCVVGVSCEMIEFLMVEFGKVFMFDLLVVIRS
jgi:hypothetical protein